MKTNQKGFSVIEVVIVIVVVGLIGAVGWLVYSRQNKTNNTETTQQTQQKAEKDIPKTSEKKEQTQLIIPEGWVKYSTGLMSFYHPKEWKIQDTDFSEYGKPERVDQSIDFVDPTKNNLVLGGFMSYKTSKGYDAVLQEAKADKNIDVIKEQTADGVKFVSYTAYGTADKDPKNANQVNVIFVADKEYRLFINPTSVDSSTANKILLTIQKK